MSTYTTEVRYICESKSGFTPDELNFKTVDEIIAASRSNVFNFDFPVYDESFRSVLESTILLHFYTREIGAETVGLWQLYLCRKLRELMPYYNKLFESALLDFNPFHDVDYTRTHEGEATGDKVGTHANTVGTTGHSATEATGTEAESTSGTTHTENSDTRTDNTTNSGTKDGTRNGTKTTHDTHSKEGTTRDYYSDTPMTKVEGVNGIPTDSGSETLAYNYYLTNYRRIANQESGENNGSETQSETTAEETAGTSRTTSNGSAEGDGTTAGTRNLSTGDNSETNTTSSTNDNGRNTEEFTNTDEYIEHITGKMGTASYSAMLKEYRETIINYMAMLLNDLEPLFMNIW